MDMSLIFINFVSKSQHMKKYILIFILDCISLCGNTAFGHIIQSIKYSYFSEGCHYTLSYKATPYYEQIGDMLIRCENDFEELYLEYNDTIMHFDHTDASKFARLINDAFLNSKTIYKEKGKLKKSNAPIIDIEIEYAPRSEDKGALYKETIYQENTAVYTPQYLALDYFVDEIVGPYIFMVDGAYESFKVHTLPHYKDGGNAGLLNYFAKTLRWPKEHDEDCVKGTIIVKFEVTANGDIGKILINRSISTAFDKEITRVLKSLPDGSFTPASRYSKPVPCWMVYPIRINTQE